MSAKQNTNQHSKKTLGFILATISLVFLISLGVFLYSQRGGNNAKNEPTKNNISSPESFSYEGVFSSLGESNNYEEACPANADEEIRFKGVVEDPEKRFSKSGSYIVVQCEYEAPLGNIDGSVGPILLEKQSDSSWKSVLSIGYQYPNNCSEMDYLIKTEQAVNDLGIKCIDESRGDFIDESGMRLPKSKS